MLFYFLTIIIMATVKVVDVLKSWEIYMDITSGLIFWKVVPKWLECPTCGLWYHTEDSLELRCCCKKKDISPLPQAGFAEFTKTGDLLVNYYGTQLYYIDERFVAEYAPAQWKSCQHCGLWYRSDDPANLRCSCSMDREFSDYVRLRHPTPPKDWKEMLRC